MDRTYLHGAMVGASMVTLLAPGVAAVYGLVWGMAAGLAIAGVFAVLMFTRKSNQEAV